MEDTVTIPRSEYEGLLDTQAWADALKAAGVDNWTWYDDALTDYRETRNA